eukprot:4168171-Prymnesium_polylepis.1
MEGAGGGGAPGRVQADGRAKKEGAGGPGEGPARAQVGGPSPRLLGARAPRSGGGPSPKLLGGRRAQ